MTVTDLTAPEKPPGWQAKLAEMILEGSYLVSDPAWPGYVKLLQMHDKCNTTFKVSHGLMGTIIGPMIGHTFFGVFRG
jgi:hypothetical protein